MNLPTNQGLLGNGVNLRLCIKKDNITVPLDLSRIISSVGYSPVVLLLQLWLKSNLPTSGWIFDTEILSPKLFLTLSQQNHPAVCFLDYMCSLKTVALLLLYVWWL